MPCEGLVVPADEMSSAIGLIGAETDGNSSIVSSAVGSWGTTVDDAPCTDRSTACPGASAGSGWLGGAGSGVGIGMDFYRFDYALVPIGALRFATASWGHRHLLVVKVGHLGHLPMYSFVAARQVYDRIM